VQVFFHILEEGLRRGKKRLDHQFRRECALTLFTKEQHVYLHFKFRTLALLSAAAEHIFDWNYWTRANK
jgi:hypothetical protein